MSNTEWQQDKYIQECLKGLAPSTKNNFIKYFPEWLTFIKMSPSEQISKRMHDLTTQDLAERVYFENQWRDFKVMLEQKETLKSFESVRSYLKCVASFFSRNGLKLNLRKGDWKPTKDQTVTEKFRITNEEIKKMYAHANTRDRALLLTLYHTGFSEVDVAHLRIENLKGLFDMPQTEHYFIEKPREKTTEPQATCISYEALHDIRSMLEERGKPQQGFLFTSLTKAKGKKAIEVRAINEAMKGLYEKAFGSEKAKEFKTKALRSAYNSALLRADMKQEIKDVMMGHERQGSRSHYDYDEITIRENYTKAFQFLTINGIQTREDMAKLRAEMNTSIIALSQTIAKQDTRIKEALDYLVILDETIAHLQKKHPEITLEDLNEIKASIQQTTNQLSRVMKFLGSKFPELNEQQA